MYYTISSSSTLNLSNFLEFYVKLVQLYASNGSEVRSTQANGIYAKDNYVNILVSDDDTTLYISVKGSSTNGYLCIYNVR